MVICLARGADLHMVQLMLLPLTVSCFSEIHIGFTYLVPFARVVPEKRTVKRACVRGCVRACVRGCVHACVRVYLWVVLLYATWLLVLSLLPCHRCNKRWKQKNVGIKQQCFVYSHDHHSRKAVCEWGKEASFKQRQKSNQYIHIHTQSSLLLFS